jgi:hypothetical protein
VDRFQEAMRDPNFRDLFHEYAQEISNPKNKKVTKTKTNINIQHKMKSQIQIFTD